MSDKSYFRITVDQYKEIIGFLDDNRTIKAIKALRDSSEKAGLKESKQAIDRLKAERRGDTNFLSTAKPIITGPKILKVVADYGSGPIEIDIEGMELRGRWLKSQAARCLPGGALAWQGAGQREQRRGLRC